MPSIPGAVKSLKLGKTDPVSDPKTLKLADYVNTALTPTIPANYQYGQVFGTNEWGMMYNDKINICTCAAAGHLIMGWTSANGQKVVPADDAIVKAYADVSGYNPATGAGDVGTGAKNVLNYWRKTGIAGHKILAYAAVDELNEDQVKQAVYLYGGCYVGLSLPLSAQQQNVWDVLQPGAAGNSTKGSWGGHVVAVIGYDANGLTVVTWGATKVMTWAFWKAYTDETYAIISLDFLSDKKAPNGFDLNALKSDLNSIAGS
jgi:hypothetical protein